MKTGNDLTITLICVAFLWAVYFLCILFHFDLWKFGIRPRSINGLLGLVFSPFLHAGIRHLFSNSMALTPLLFFSLAYNRQLAVKAIVFIALAGGMGVWLFGSSRSVHIGASGIIFGLLGYLLTIGILRRSLSALFVSLIVACYYGWMLFSLFVVLPGVSWTGHFFGFVAGALAARLTAGTQSLEERKKP